MIRPVGGSSAPREARVPLETVSGFGDSLEALLTRPEPARATDGIQFSRHAQARMESRGIKLHADDLEDLSTAVDKLASRGAKESLILLGDNAFIVGVGGRKVVTAMTRQEAAGNVFTQIDSTVVVR